MDERLKKQLAFALEIDKEKNILRQTHLSGHGRRENDAEHAWHMAIMAYLLREYANEEVNITKVMLMCLIHDIVEIEAGDTYAYDEEGPVSYTHLDVYKRQVHSFLQLYQGSAPDGAEMAGMLWRMGDRNGIRAGRGRRHAGRYRRSRQEQPAGIRMCTDGIG